MMEDLLAAASFETDDLLLEELPSMPAGADGSIATMLRQPAWQGKYLAFDERYLSDSIFYPRILSTLMSDLTLRGTTSERGWRQGDLFEPPNNDARSAFFFKSAMGTGKTTMLYEYLKTVDAWEREMRMANADMTPLRIVVIVARVALGTMYSDKLAELGFVFYKDSVDHVIEDNRVIITPHSYGRLQRVTMRGGEAMKRFMAVDIMIADEWLTTMASLNDKTMKNRRGLFYAIWQQYWRCDKTQFIVIDACLDSSAVETLERLTRYEGRGDARRLTPKECYMIYNCHRPADADQIRVVDSLDLFYQCIKEAIAVCIDEDWERRQLIVARHANDPDFVAPDPEFQIVIAHASLQKQQTLHQLLVSNFPDYCNERTCVIINSKSGGMNLRTSDWCKYYIIQHTSTIAAGSDYNPPKQGRHVYVFSYTFDKIPAPLMAQMTFRARLPIVKTVTFFIPRQPKRDPQLCVNRTELLRHMEMTASFCDLPRLANDRSIYELVEEEVDGEVCYVPRLNGHDFGLDVVVDQMISQNRALNDYGEYMVDVLADMSEFWRSVKNSGSYVRATERVQTSDIAALKREREALAIYKNTTFVKMFAFFLDELALDARMPIDDMIKRFDAQKNRSIRARQNTDGVFVYETCIMLKSLGLRELPFRGETLLLDLLEEFVAENAAWFQTNWESFRQLCRGSAEVTRESVSEYIQQIETRAKAPADAVRVFYILQAISVFVPNAVIEDADGSLRFRPLYSVNPAVLHCFAPTAVEIKSTLMKDASKIAIVDLSDKSPNIYRYAFGDCKGFPAALNGAMAYLCDKDACPDPSQFKKMRGIISHVCHELGKSCLDAVGMKLAGNSNDTRKYNETVPYQTAKASVTIYNLAKGGDTPSVVYQLHRHIESLRRTKDGIVDIGWHVLKNELMGWKYLPLWENLC